MTIMMTSDMPGITQADYEQLAAALLPLLQAADGFIAHAAGPVEGGYQVTEVWESEVPAALPDDPGISRTARALTYRGTRPLQGRCGLFTRCAELTR